jgi:hypothetical protein
VEQPDEQPEGLSQLLVRLKGLEAWDEFLVGVRETTAAERETWEDRHGSIIARGEAKSPDSLRRHKRYCRESRFEAFQPFSNGRRKLECALRWFHAVPARREKRVTNYVAEAVQGMTHSRWSYHQ